MEKFNEAKAKELYARPLPNPIPNPAIIVVGADWCPDTKQTMINNGYATETAEGIPIFYVNDNTPEGHAFLKNIPDAGEVLGAGFDAPEASKAKGAGRAYNYPTVIYTAVDQKEGTTFSARVYADTVPVGGLADMKSINALYAAQKKSDELAKNPYAIWRDADKTAQFLDEQLKKPLPEGLPPEGTVIAVVNRNCSHCQDFLARSGYQTRTEDGRPILYVDLSTDAGEAYLKKHPQLDGMVEGIPTTIGVGKNGELQLISETPSDGIKALFPTFYAEQQKPNAKQPQPLTANAYPELVVPLEGGEVTANQRNLMVLASFRGKQVDFDQDGRIDQTDINYIKAQLQSQGVAAAEMSNAQAVRHYIAEPATEEKQR